MVTFSYLLGTEPRAVLSGANREGLINWVDREAGVSRVTKLCQPSLCSDARPGNRCLCPYCAHDVMSRAVERVASRIPCLRARPGRRVDCLSSSLLQASVFWSISYYTSPFAFFYLYRKGQCALLSEAAGRKRAGRWQDFLFRQESFAPESVVLNLPNPVTL